MRPLVLPALAALALLLFAVVAAGRMERARTAEGEITGEVPAQGGFALVIWGGGTTAQLQTAAAFGGCALVSAWFATAGEFVGNIYGAPPFVNARFLERFAGSAMPPRTRHSSSPASPRRPCRVPPGRRRPSPHRPRPRRRHPRPPA